MKFKKDQFQLKLQGKTAVFIDWANVYRWKDSLKKVVDLEKLYHHLKTYRQVKEINFYFGTDVHPASKSQIKRAHEIGCRIITKPVKYIRTLTETGEWVNLRKCDFDLEIGLDCFERLDKFDGFIVFSGDGDFATLYERLINKRKQVIVIYMYGSLGREVWNIKRGIFKASILKLGVNVFKKMTPNRRSGA
ncbi:MAG: NYN domain-containing protein [Patescibacteria group bacterium]|nr:NYN domain-containing protein [Patescibacteria group bacterium]